jgi:hypothetical protein
MGTDSLRDLHTPGVGSGEWGVGSGEWGVGSGEWGVGRMSFYSFTAYSASRAGLNLCSDYTIYIIYTQPFSGFQAMVRPRGKLRITSRASEGEPFKKIRCRSWFKTICWQLKTPLLSPTWQARRWIACALPPKDYIIITCSCSIYILFFLSIFATLILCCYICCIRTRFYPIPPSGGS